MNEKEFCTRAAAIALACELDRLNIGGGVAPISDDADTSGVYLEAVERGETRPQVGDDQFRYLLRFNNGVSGVVAGEAVNTEDSPGHAYAEIGAAVAAAYDGGDEAAEMEPESGGGGGRRSRRRGGR